MKIHLNAITFALAAGLAASSQPSEALRPPPSPPPHTSRPVIGILSVPLESSGCSTVLGHAIQPEDDAATSCFDDVYVKWVEAAGARVVPIPYDSTTDELDHLFDSLNGLLFTGGGADLSNLHVPYLQTAGHLLNRTIDAFVSQGQNIPVWGSCMGIQTISILVAQDPSVLTTGFVGVDPLSMPLNLTAAAKSSRMFGSIPDIVTNAIATQPLTTNLHHDGVPPQMFATNPHLAAFFDVLSTNEDLAGQPFVSTIEGKTVPVYGAQWHPERPQFEWHKIDPNTGLDPVNHDAMAVLAMQSFANFFVGEARRNNHSFASEDELVSKLIYNYKSVGTTDYQAYFFSANDSSSVAKN